MIPLVITNIYEERDLNLVGWSRSVDPNEMAINKSTFSRVDDNGVNVYVAGNENTIKKLTIEPTTLDVKEQANIEVPSDPYYPYWVSPDDRTVIYLLKNKLYLLKDEENQILDENVEDLFVNENTILYQKDNEVFSLNTSDFSSSKLGAGDDLMTLSIDRQSPSYISMHEYGEIAGVEFIYHRWEEGQYKSSSVYIKDSFTLPVAEIEFSEFNNNLHLIYQTTSIKGGGKARTNHYLSIPLNKEKSELMDTKLQVFTKSLTQIDTVSEFQFYQVDDQLRLLFSGKGELKHSVTNTNLYIASIQDERWIANRLSTHYDPVIEPLTLSKTHSTWLSHDGDQYTVMAASTSPDVISESKNLTKNDLLRALEDSVTSLTSAFIMNLFAILLIIPPMIVVFISKFFEVENTKRAEIVAKVAFSLTTFLFVQKTLNVSFYSEAPDYLTFAGVNIFLPIAILFVSLAVERYSKRRDWEFEGRVFYFIGISVWITSLLIGPYII